MSLSGKSALITGATGAIGAAICEELLKNGVINLAAIDISSNEPTVVAQWRKSFPKASIRYFKVDVSSQEELEKCYADFVKDIPSLDIVVNCAGFIDEKLFRKMIQVNLCGVIGSTFIAMEYMRKDTGRGKGGVILTIASATGLIPLALAPSYSASKQGVVAFKRALAHDRDYMGIKFLTLCPGATQSQMYQQAFKVQNTLESEQEKLNALKEGCLAQSPVVVGEASVKLINEAKSGSVWLIKDNKLTEQNLPKIEF